MEKLLMDASEKGVWKHAVAKHHSGNTWKFDILLPKICFGFISRGITSGYFVSLPRGSNPNLSVGTGVDSVSCKYLILSYPLSDPNPTHSVVILPKEVSTSSDLNFFYSDSLLPPLDNIPLQSDELIEEFLAEHFENKALE